MEEESPPLVCLSALHAWAKGSIDPATNSLSNVFIEGVLLVESDNVIERDKGQQLIYSSINSLFEEPASAASAAPSFHAGYLKKLLDVASTELLSHSKWHVQGIGLAVIKAFLEKFLCSQIICSSNVVESAIAIAKQFLSHQENRLREASADILADIATQQPQQLLVMIQYLCDRILGEFEEIQCDSGASEHDANPVAVQKYLKEEYVYFTHHGVYLDNAFSCLKRLSSSNTSIASMDYNLLIGLATKASLHIQKHIRESAVGLAQAIASTISNDSFGSLAQLCADIIGRGLSDPYTQVRHQSVRAVKTFFDKCVECELKEVYIPQLIFRLCFNIHHPAEGLKMITRTAWMEIFPVGGRQLVAQNALATTKHYINSSYSHNHEIRQAAMICLQEMLSQVMNTSEQSKLAVRSQVPEIFIAAINCSDLEPHALVREQSFKCMGKLLEAAGDLIGTVEKERMKAIAQRNLADYSHTTKQSAAMLLGVLFKQSFSENNSKETFVEALKQRLTGLKNEGLPKEAVTAQADPSNNQSAAGSKERFQAESLEGLVALVKETAFSLGTEQSETIKDLCGLIVYNMRALSFEKSENIRENIWIMLADTVCNGMLKKQAKELIEDLLDPLFGDFAHHRSNVANAAQSFIKQLAKLVGPNILRGRIQSHGVEAYLLKYDSLNNLHL